MCLVLNHILSVALSPLAALAALFNAVWRYKRGESNIMERLGIWGNTPTNVIWFHGASVGECLSLRPLLTLLNQKSGNPVLLTTTTVAARSVMSKIHHHVRHQVWDVWPLVALRIKRTKPIIYVTVESEIWPIWLWTLHQYGVPIMLLNARLSDRTMQRWGLFPSIARSIFSTICYATTTCEKRARFLRTMGVQYVDHQPHLKYMSDPLPIDNLTLEKYQRVVGDRPIWLAASVHPSERETVINTIMNAPSRTLTIIAPRHIHTVNDWCDELSQKGLKGIKHSQFDGSLGEEISYIIVDSMGELPTFYSLCPVVLVGGNLVPGIGGHNIIEPGMFGCAVIWGPHVDSCRDVCDDLAGQGFPLQNPSELTATVCNLLQNPEQAHKKGTQMKEKLMQQQVNLQSWAETWLERITSISGAKC